MNKIRTAEQNSIKPTVCSGRITEYLQSLSWEDLVIGLAENEIAQGIEKIDPKLEAISTLLVLEIERRSI